MVSLRAKKIIYAILSVVVIVGAYKYFHHHSDTKAEVRNKITDWDMTCGKTVIKPGMTDDDLTKACGLADQSQTVDETTYSLMYLRGEGKEIDVLIYNHKIVTIDYLIYITSIEDKSTEPKNPLPQLPGQ